MPALLQWNASPARLGENAGDHLAAASPGGRGRAKGRAGAGFGGRADGCTYDGNERPIFLVSPRTGNVRACAPT